MSELTDMADTIARVSASGTPLTATTNRNVRPPIGLSGFAKAGKTEAAKFIEAHFSYERQHIAEPLRRMLTSLLLDWGMHPQEIAEYLTGDRKEEVIPCLGVTSRHAQITLGTEWGRNLIAADLWARLWAYQAAASGKAVMNDSVRFPNEQREIHRVRGITILVTRPGAGPVAYRWKRLGPLLYRWFGCMWGVHDSERVDRLRPDYVIVNDGTIGDLHDSIARVLAAE